jgi:Asp/Glu/hydantoin racemase
MEQSIVVIHGIKNTLDIMTELLTQRFPEYSVFHLYDQFLAQDPEIRGEFTKTNLNRFYFLLKSAELTGAKLILLACSLPCLYADTLRPLIGIPIFGILDASVNIAAEKNGKVGFLSTSRGSSETMMGLLQKKENVKCDVVRIICGEALRALRQGDSALHDKLILEEAVKLKGMDLIILTQLSMSHLKNDIQNICGCSVINSEQPCLDELSLFLNGNSGNR